MAVIRMAVPQPVINKNHPLRHFPMRFLELVKCSSGNIANGNSKHRTTWLRLTRSVTLPFPRTLMIRIAGKIASVRVMSRRTHGRIRQCMNPSITTCPAIVPVIVLL